MRQKRSKHLSVFEEKCLCVFGGRTWPVFPDVLSRLRSLRNGPSTTWGLADRRSTSTSISTTSTMTETAATTTPRLHPSSCHGQARGVTTSVSAAIQAEVATTFALEEATTLAATRWPSDPPGITWDSAEITAGSAVPISELIMCVLGVRWTYQKSWAKVTVIGRMKPRNARITSGSVNVSRNNGDCVACDDVA